MTPPPPSRTSASRVKIPASMATALPAALTVRAAAGEPQQNSGPTCVTPATLVLFRGGAVVLNTMVD